MDARLTLAFSLMGEKSFNSDHKPVASLDRIIKPHILIALIAIQAHPNV
jgi:hypothetical protein